MSHKKPYPPNKTLANPKRDIVNMNDHLFRLDRNQDDGLMGVIDSAGQFTTTERVALFDAVQAFMVPVESCKHGFIMAHHVTLEMTYKNDEDSVFTQQCDGAALNVE